MEESGYCVAVVGATGLVGEAMLRILEQRNFPIRELRALASERSVGRRIAFRDRELVVEAASAQSLAGVDLALFSAGSGPSLELAPVVAAAGGVVVDNSSAWRMTESVPLVVPEVNAEAASAHQGIIANPNCATIQLVVALAPLHRAAVLRRVVVDTYQSASGQGRPLLSELEEQYQSLVSGLPLTSALLAAPLAGNLVPQIDVFGDGGHTREESKVRLETRRIMGLPQLRLAVTCVRVPVAVGHSEAVHVEFESELTAENARQLLARAPGIEVVDDPGQRRYPMPSLAAGRDEVFVGRIRADDSVAHGISMWVVSDNLRKGAALNAVQIAELLHFNRGLRVAD